MHLEPLCPDPVAWRISLLAPEQDRIVLSLEPRRTAVACPVCGTDSRRVHSRYQRRPWDLPWGRWPVQLMVQARRFFCDAPGCPRRIFVEPVPGLLARYARQTERWRQALLALAYASSAEVAARVAWFLGYGASPDTLIRRQRAERFAFPAPRVLGVDEFALRRGHTYGTLLVDLERHQPVAVLEGRTAEPWATWLQAHPTVAILVRDRAGASAAAGRPAAPDALQVADRFHLGQNSSDALQTLLHSRQWSPSTPATPPPGFPGVSAAPPACTAEHPRQARPPTAGKRAAWETVQEYRGRGLSLRPMAQVVGLDRRTVRRYLEADQPPVYPVRRPRPTQLTPYLAYLAERWAQGCQHARQLYDELVPRGYRGSASMVRVIMRPWRTRQEATPAALTRSQLARLRLSSASHLTEAERGVLEDFLRGNPLRDRGYELKPRLHTLLAKRDLPALEPWLQAAAASELPSFQAGARSFRQDSAALQAALTMPWSTGPCAGQICRVKLIKRLGYGRAKLDLLRQRILHRMAGLVRHVNQPREVKPPLAA